MKGFGYSREKQLIAKALETRNREEMKKTLGELLQHLSPRQVTNLVFKVISKQSPADRVWAYGSLLPQELWEDILPAILSSLYDFFKERGLKPGIDFGRTDEGLWLSRAESEAMLPELPDNLREIFEMFVKEDLLSLEDALPVKELEKQLGVPFADNLLRRIEQRLPTLTDGEAATYLAKIWAGVQERTGILVADFMLEKIHRDKRLHKILKRVVQDKTEPNSDWVEDLICAAGGESEIRPNPEKPDEFLITPRGIELFDTVCSRRESLSSLITIVPVENPPQPQE